MQCRQELAKLSLVRVKVANALGELVAGHHVFVESPVKVGLSEDLTFVRRPQMSRVERAWQLADVAVREAYTRRVPPALVLGVMMTENDELKSTARSSVGGCLPRCSACRAGR